jgi:Holliday junction resolvase RusA-like endonuclease
MNLAMYFSADLYNLKPISVNKAYANSFGKHGRMKTRDYLEFEYEVTKQLDLLAIRELYRKEIKDKRCPLELNFEFFYNVYKKNSDELSLTSGDVSNMIKPLEDILSNYMDFNDAQIMSVGAEKYQHENEDDFRIEIGCWYVGDDKKLSEELKEKHANYAKKLHSL